MANPNCPVCGSEDTEKREVKHVLAIPFGAAAEWTDTTCTCKSCGSEGDFAKCGHAHAVLAIKRATRNTVVPMLKYLEDMGLSRRYIERALRLPVKSIDDRWLRGDERDLDPVVVALLRLVRAYPWLLSVSDANFDEKVVSLYEKSKEDK